MEVVPYIYVKDLTWDEILEIVTVEDVEGDQARRMFWYADNGDAIAPEPLLGKIFFSMDDADLLGPIFKASNRNNISIEYFVIYLVPEQQKVMDILDVDPVVLRIWLKDNPKRFPDFVIKELSELGKGVLGVNLKYSMGSILAAIRWLEKLYTFIIRSEPNVFEDIMEVF